MKIFLFKNKKKKRNEEQKQNNIIKLFSFYL